VSRFYYDFEFLEDGSTIMPLSIGIVSFDGYSTYYAGFSDVDHVRARAEPWLAKNVFPKMPPMTAKRFWKPKATIAQEVLGFFGIVRGVAQQGVPELWADHASYDHVALCQLYGRMIDLPSGMPMFTMDLQQQLVATGFRRAELPVQDPETEHHALEDALHLRRCHRWVLGLDQ